MNRKFCRKGTGELGVRSQYYLRKALRERRNETRQEEQKQRDESSGSSSESDHDEGNTHANIGVGIEQRQPEEPPHQENNVHNLRMEPEIARNETHGANIRGVGDQRNVIIEEEHGRIEERMEHDHQRNDEQPLVVGPDNLGDDDIQPENRLGGVNIAIGVNIADFEGNFSNSEESDSEAEDAELFNNRANRPLYGGASITVGESMLLVLGIMLAHNLTISCVADLLKVIQFHCLNVALQKVSAYKFRKYFSLDDKETFTKHYYCSKCSTSLEGPNARCDICDELTTASYFIAMPFLKQLQEMLRRDNFYEQLQHRYNRNNKPGYIQDIYDGVIYKRLFDNGGFLSNPNNISLTWYTDGVPVFLSSKTSMWPLYLCINELPYQMRTKQENILLAGVWFGKTKPCANLFLNKLRPHFESLVHGKSFRIGGRSVRMQGILLAGVADVPAKTQFLNLTLYSGAYGCCNCKLRGETFHHPTGGHSHIFPYTRDIEERTSVETIQQARRVVRGRIEGGLMGVKGLSALFTLMPDFIEGTGIDVMHQVYGGVVKKLLQLWFDAQHGTQPFSLRNVVDSVNRRLIAVKPPKWVHRMPRTVNELCHWKASELKMWFYYYSAPVLSGILLPLYFNHYLRLILAISLLNYQEISTNDIEKAKKLIHRFVREFSELYGEQHSTINVHGLLHLPRCVERLGPLWAFSCFPFEDLNGRLLRSIHGTSHLESQVAVRHCQKIKLQSNFEKLADGSIKDFLIHSKKKQVAINERIFQSCYSVGSYSALENVPPFIFMAFQDFNINPRSITTYLRLLKGGKLFICDKYDMNLKTKSSYVLFRKNNRRKVGCLVVFVKRFNCDCRRDCHCQHPPEHFAILNEVRLVSIFQAADDEGGISALWHLQRSQRSNVITAVPVRDLINVVVFISWDGGEPLVGLPINEEEKE